MEARKSKLIVISICLLSLLGYSQEVLELDRYEKLVMEQHPIAYQADLLTRSARGIELQGKGGFDAKIEGDLNQKYFEDKKYYSRSYVGLKVPTWMGLTLQTGYELNDGVFLSQEATVPESGLINLGAELNVFKGLIFDQRRADLRQAQNLVKMTELERQLMLNQLRFDAITAYLEWQKTSEKFKIIENSYNTAILRLENVRESALIGEKPQVDTLKAYIQMQDREVKLNDAQTELNNARLLLNTFLWKDGKVPLELEDNTVPESIENWLEVTNLEPTDSIVSSHPEFLYAQYKIDANRIDYRLKKESLKPDLNLKYNAITYQNPNSFAQNLSINNYKWGVSLSYAIPNRKARGKLMLTEVKLQDSEFDLTDKQAQIKMKIDRSLNNWQNTLITGSTYQSATDNYKALLDAETTLYQTGESSLFLVNQRDLDYLDAALKLVELRYKNKKAVAYYEYSSMRW